MFSECFDGDDQDISNGHVECLENNQKNKHMVEKEKEKINWGKSQDDLHADGK